MSLIGLIKTSCNKKRIFLISIIALTASCYRTDTETNLIKYVNESGVDIRIKGLVEGDSDEVLTIQIPDGKSYSFEPFNEFAGALEVKQRGLLGCDTAYIYYGEERMMMYSNKTESLRQADNPISGLGYKSVCIKKNKLYAEEFTFTRAMYDAATPIDHPAEE